MFDPVYEMAEQARYDLRNDLQKIKEAETQIIHLKSNNASAEQIDQVEMQLGLWRMSASLNAHIMRQGGLEL